MRYGLIGNTIMYGGIATLFGYLFWEINEMSKSMAKFDENHPANDIYKPENVQRFIQHKNKYSEKEVGTVFKQYSSKNNLTQSNENDESDI